MLHARSFWPCPQVRDLHFSIQPPVIRFLAHLRAPDSCYSYCSADHSNHHSQRILAIPLLTGLRERRCVIFCQINNRPELTLVRVPTPISNSISLTRLQQTVRKAITRDIANFSYLTFLLVSFWSNTKCGGQCSLWSVPHSVPCRQCTVVNTG
jgi:hypothetical protein